MTSQHAVVLHAPDLARQTVQPSHTCTKCGRGSERQAGPGGGGLDARFVCRNTMKVTAGRAKNAGRTTGEKGTFYGPPPNFMLELPAGGDRPGSRAAYDVLPCTASRQLQIAFA